MWHFLLTVGAVIHHGRDLGFGEAVRRVIQRLRVQTTADYDYDAHFSLPFLRDTFLFKANDSVITSRLPQGAESYNLSILLSRVAATITNQPSQAKLVVAPGLADKLFGAFGLVQSVKAGMTGMDFAKDWQNGSWVPLNLEDHRFMAGWSFRKG